MVSTVVSTVVVLWCQKVVSFRGFLRVGFVISVENPTKTRVFWQNCQNPENTENQRKQWCPESGVQKGVVLDTFLLISDILVNKPRIGQGDFERMAKTRVLVKTRVLA